MTPFRPSRRAGTRPDPHLDLKMVLFVVGAGFGAAGMITDRGILVLIGIAFLAAGLLLRFRRSPAEDAEAGPAHEPDHEPRHAPGDGPAPGDEDHSP